MPAVQTLITALGKLAPTRPPARGRRVSPRGVTLRRSLVPAADAYARGGHEPPLEEVLGDPIVRALMRSDGVTPGEVRRVLDEARRRRRQSRPSPAGSSPSTATTFVPDSSRSAS